MVQIMFDKLPAFMLFSIFWMLLLSGITVGIQTFYMNDELSLLLVSPVRPRVIFLTKFVETTLVNSALFLTLAVPVLAAYLTSRGELKPLTIPLGLISLAAFASIPTLIGLLLCFLLMRILPAGRTRDILGASGIALFAVIYMLFSLGARRISDPDELQSISNRMSTVMARPVFHQGPWEWAARSIQSADFPSLLCLCAVAALTCYLTLLVADKIHADGWSRSLEAGTKPVGNNPSHGVWENRLRALPGPIRAIYLKDLITLRRDLRQLSMLLIPIAVVGVYLINIVESRSLSRLPSIFFVHTMLFMLAPIALRLALSGYVAENRAIWLSLVSPGNTWYLLWGKWLYSMSLCVPLSICAMLGYSLLMHQAGSDILINMWQTLLTMAGFCGIGVGAGALIFDFNAENPRFGVPSGSQFVILGLQFLYSLLLAAVSGTEWYLIRSGMFTSPLVAMLAFILCIIITAVFLFSPMAIGAKRLSKLEI